MHIMRKLVLVFLLALPLFGCVIDNLHVVDKVFLVSDLIIEPIEKELQGSFGNSSSGSTVKSPSYSKYEYSEPMLCSLTTKVESGKRVWQDPSEPDVKRLMVKVRDRELTLEKCDAALNTSSTKT